MASEVATAYVSLLPSFRGLKSAIASEVGPGIKQGTKQAEGAASEAGAGIGKKLGGAVAAAFAAVGVGKLIGDALSKQANTANLQASLGLGPKRASQLGKIAGKLYANNFGDSLQDASAAVRAVSQNITGLNDTDLSAISGKVLKLSNLFDQDLGGTAKAVGQLIRTGMAKDATEAVDLITVGLQKIPGAGDDLLDTFNEYSTQFRKLGLEGPEALGLIQQAVAAGARDTDIAADALKEFSIRAVDGSTATADGFALIGLNAAEMSAKIAQGGPAASEGLEQTLDALRAVEDPAIQAQAAAALFGAQAEDMGAALLAFDPATAVQGLGDVSGAAGKMTDALGGTAQANINTFFRTLKQGAVNVLGATVLPAIAAFAGFLSTNVGPAVQVVVGWVEQNLVPVLRELGEWISNNVMPVWAKLVAFFEDKIAPAAAAVGEAFLGLIAFLAPVAAWIYTRLADAFNFVLVVLGGVVNFIAANADWMLPLIAGIAGAITAFRLLKVVMSTNPFLLLIAAVIAIGTLIYENWTAIKNFFVGLWQSITGAIVAAWNWIGQFFAGLWQAILGFFVGAGQWLLGVGKSIINGLWTGIKWIWDTIIVGFFGGIFTWVIGIFATAITWLLQVGKNILQGLWNGIQFIWTTVVNFFTNLGSSILGAIVDAVSWLWQTGSDIISGLLTGIGDAFVDVAAWLAALPVKMLQAMGEAGDWLYSAGKDAMQGFLKGMGSEEGTIQVEMAESGDVLGIGNLVLDWGLASGGYVRGPGTGTSDSIPAMLSDGEYVINAASTARNLPLLRAINSGQGFAAGGLVGGGSGGGAELMSVAAGGTVVANSEDAAKRAQAAGLALMQGLATGIAAGLPLVQVQLDRLRPMTEAEFASAPTWLPDNGIVLMRGLASGMTVGMVTVQRFLDTVYPTVDGEFRTAGTWLPGHGRSLLLGFLNGALLGWAAVRAWLATVRPTINGVFVTAGTWLPPHGTSLMRGFLSGMVAGWPAIATQMRSQKSNILTYHDDADLWLVPAGRDLSGGLLGGMRDTIDDPAKVKGIADALIAALKKEFGIKSPARSMIPLGEMISAGVFEGILKNDPKAFLKKVFGSMPEALQKLVQSGHLSFEDIAGSPKAMEAFGPAAGGGLGGTGQIPANVAGNLEAWVRAAMAVTGVPANWLGPLMSLAMHESGGNPNAINLWDSNAAAGIPSIGLFQTIQPTFDAYSLGGDIRSPVANAVAAIRYILARYGSIFQIASYTPNGFVGGYETGTDYVPRTGLALIHKGEAVIPADENRRGRGVNYELHFHEQRSTPAPRQMVDALQDVDFLYGGAR